LSPPLSIVRGLVCARLSGFDCDRCLPAGSGWLFLLCGIWVASAAERVALTIQLAGL